MPRAITPRYLPNVDVVIIQFTCNPETVDPAIFNMHEAVLKAAHQYDIQLGQTFDVQFVDHERERLIARQRYIVTRAVAQMVTSEVSSYQTMTKNIVRRAVEPIGDMLIFDHDDLAPELAKPTPKPNTLEEITAAGEDDGSQDRKPKRRRRKIGEPKNYSDMTVSGLQRLKKERTGKGFPPGTTQAKMVAALEALDKAAA